MIRKPSTEQLLKALRGDLKGNDGYSPVKGKDYFTPQEIQEIISFIQSNVHDGYTPVKGTDYVDGYTPVKGKDYFDGRKGEPGYTPIREVDYWTTDDKAKIEAYVLKMIESKVPSTSQIISKLPKAKKIQYSDIEGAPDVSDLPKLIDFLKRGGFRGGGSSGGSVSPLTTKGDIYTFDSANQRLPVGTNGQVLSADNTQATGLKWIALSGGGDMLLAASQIVSGLKTFLDGTLGLRNVANTFTSFFTNTNTASRTYTLPDKNGTVAMTSDATPPARLINTTAPLSGGGDLSADRTLTTSMSTNKLIGRGTAGTGVMEEITLGTNLSLTGTTLNATGGGGVAWGAITGTLSSQTDLQSALNVKASKAFAVAMSVSL